MGKKVLVFDLDGTLIDTLRLAEEAYLYASKKLGVEIDLKELRKSFGLGPETILSRILPSAPESLREEFEKLKNKKFLELLQKEAKPFPMAKELLKELKDKYILVLLSAGEKERTEILIKKFSLKFDLVVYPEEVGKNKPDPGLIHYIIRKTGAAPEDVLVIGDSIWDIRMAKEAGAVGIGICSGAYTTDELYKEGASRVFRDLKELLNFLTGLGDNMEEEIYIVTAALPYVNYVPHIGHVIGSQLPADIFARFLRILGKKVIFISGTDEHGSATEITAKKLGITPEELVTKMRKIHEKVYRWFEISYDIFSHTSKNEIHKEVTQEIFLRIKKGSFLKEKEIEMFYCKKCDQFLPDRFVKGKCPYCGYEDANGDQCEKCGRLLSPTELISPKCSICGSAPELRKTKHLFLDFTKLKGKLETYVENRKKEWKEYVYSQALATLRELKERCITRDLKYGIEVPDPNWKGKVFYVWFDAPIGYLSFLKELVGEKYLNIWNKAKIYHFLGKDNIPFHTIWWPGILIAAGIKPPEYVIGLNFLNLEGRKISKSKRWGVFGPGVLEAGLPPDVWRFILSLLLPEEKDSDFKWGFFKEMIEKELIGNYLNFYYRVVTFSFKEGGKIPFYLDLEVKEKVRECYKEYLKNFWKVELRKALKVALALSDFGNSYFQNKEPWKKSEKERKKILSTSLFILRAASIMLYPFIPCFSSKILSIIGEKPELKEILSEKEEWVVKKPEIIFRKVEDWKKIKEKAQRVPDISEFL